MRFSTALAVVAIAASAANAIDTIITQDRHFYTSSDKKPFFIRGVDYQPGGSAGVESGKDPLSDADICARDIFLFQKLGINTIRVYSVDPTIDHDACMTLLAAAGIYVVLDVNTPLENQHIVAPEPWTSYNPIYMTHVFTVMEVFGGYDNVLGYFAGNEVVFQEDSAKVAPRYIKATIRDMRAYQTKRKLRNIPIGYSNADDLDYRISMGDYLACGSTGFIDFFAVNSYQWCGDNSFVGSGYDGLVADYESFPLPLFLSEYGCNLVRPRLFQETVSLYSSNMTGVFSGGLVYEYSQEKSDYGIVDVSAPDGSAKILVEYDTLQKQYIAAGSSPTIPANAKTFTRPTTCAASYEHINGTSILPDVLDDITKLINNGIPTNGWKRGKLLDISAVKTTTTKKIYDSAGNEITSKTIGKDATTTGGTASPSESKKAGSVKNAGISTGLVAVVAAMLGLAM